MCASFSRDRKERRTRSAKAASGTAQWYSSRSNGVRGTGDRKQESREKRDRSLRLRLLLSHAHPSLTPWTTVPAAASGRRGEGERLARDSLPHFHDCTLAPTCALTRSLAHSLMTATEDQGDRSGVALLKTSRHQIRDQSIALLVLLPVLCPDVQ